VRKIKNAKAGNRVVGPIEKHARACVGEVG
jgi:hypothetical protein